MEALTDWKGNIISPGDTIVLVRTKHMFGPLHLLFPKTGEYIQIEEEPPEHIWKTGDEYEIVGTEEFPLISFESNGFKCISSLQGFFEAYPIDSCVVCIKGVSDNEQDYYMEYFKVK